MELEYLIIVAAVNIQNQTIYLYHRIL